MVDQIKNLVMLVTVLQPRIKEAPYLPVSTASLPIAPFRFDPPLLSLLAQQPQAMKI